MKAPASAAGVASILCLLMAGVALLILNDTNAGILLATLAVFNWVTAWGMRE